MGLSSALKINPAYSSSFLPLMTAEIFAGLQYLCLASKQQGLFKGLDEHLQKCKRCRARWIWLSRLWLCAELEQGSTALGLP